MTISSRHSKPSKVRLQDLARAANVSISTASLALRGDPAVSEETRQRITQLQQQLGYVRLRQESATTRTRSAKRRFLFALIDRTFDFEPYSAILDGAMTGCREHKCELSVVNVRNSPNDMKHVIDEHGTEAAGVVLAGDVSDEVVAQCEASGIPYIVAGFHRFSRPVHSVQVNSEAIANRIVERALSEGKRNFGYIAKLPSIYFNRQFLISLRIALSSEGLTLSDDYVFYDGLEAMTLPGTCDRILSGTPRIDALVTPLSDHADIYRAALSREVDPPTIYSIATSSTNPGTEKFPNLDIGPQTMGQVAVDRLLQRAGGQHDLDIPYTCQLFPGGWLDQASEA